MSKKISELPVAPDYTLTDYLPIVDAETDATQKLYISQLVTASYGLSASFLTLGDATTGAAPTTGLLRIPYSSGYVNIMTWQQGGNFPLLRTDASTARWLLGSLGGAYGYIYGYTLDLDGWAGITFGNQGTPAFTVTPSEGTKFATQVTASLGVSASFLNYDVGAGTAKTGFIRTGWANGKPTVLWTANNAGTDYQVLALDTTGHIFLGESTATAWDGNFYVSTLNLWGKTNMIFYGTGAGNEVMRTTVNGVLAQAVTASLGVSASNMTVGSRIDTVPTDVLLYVSGTSGLTGSNAGRKISLFNSDVVMSGSLALLNSVANYSSRPAVGNRGARFQPLDGTVEFVDDGTQWRPKIGGTLGYEVPSSSSFASVFTAGRQTTVTNDNGVLYLSASNFSGQDFRILKRSIPAGIFSATIHIVGLFPPNASGLPWAGLILRESSTGKVDSWGSYAAGPANKSATVPAPALNRNWNTAADTSASPASFTNTDFVDYHISPVHSWGSSGIWLQIYYDPSGNKVYRYSNDGKHYRDVIVVSKSDVFTPDEVGFCIANLGGIGNAGGTDSSMQAVVDSWYVG